MYLIKFTGTKYGTEDGEPHVFFAYHHRTPTGVGKPFQTYAAAKARLGMCPPLLCKAEIIKVGS